MASNIQTKKVFFGMGTVNSITVFEDAEEALSAAKDRVKELDCKLSAYAHDSEICNINKNAGISPVKVSKDTFRIIKHSVMYSEFTDGYFDITSRPLSQLWKQAMKCGENPDSMQISQAKELIDYKNIIFDNENRTIMLRKKDQQLDLGAIAKGYAADEVRKLLLSYGVRNAVINFGGTIINIGPARKIGLQKPFASNGKTYASIKITDGKSVVTSGIYEQFRIIDNNLIHHITDIRTGYPANSGLIAVTLIGNNAEELDALATSAFIIGADNSLKLLKIRNIDAIFITDKQEIYATEKIKNEIIAAK